MGNAELDSLLAKGCRQLEIPLSRQTLASLVWYCGELIKWNKKINLIGRAGEEEVIDKHFLDSLAIIPVLEDLKEKSILDLGSGAGFPGLVLKTVMPALSLVLVEARLKRAAFLRHIIRNLKLTEVEVMALHLESSPPAGMENTCPLIISRAFASISSFLDLIKGYSAPEGRVICMKGPRAEKEIEEWATTQWDSPFTLQHIHYYHLPFSGAERALVIFRK